MISVRDRGGILRQHAEPGSGVASNPFSSGDQVGAVVASGCHECVCENIFSQVMERVLAVKDTCGGNVCSLTGFEAFRRRNLAISADYASIYLTLDGEAKRLKFAGGAAFGSTHIGYAMDLALETLRAMGNPGRSGEIDLETPDGRGISSDEDYLPLDFTEGMAWLLTGVAYEDTLTGLRRLTYGNLAIYMDLGAVLWFCLLHEQRFHFFRDGRVDEFMECFDRFVLYVKDNHASDHPVYAEGGSFGSNTGGYLRDGLRALAQGDVEGSLKVVDHEQRNILQPYMYRLEPALVPTADLNLLGSDEEFSNFMNALETVQLGNGIGSDPRLHGIRAILSAYREPYLLGEEQIRPHRQFFAHGDQPFVFPFTQSYGTDFTEPDVRTPWFQDVVRHFVTVENNAFPWPDMRQTSPYRRYLLQRGEISAFSSIDPTVSPPDTQAILYSDLARIRGS